MGRHVLLRAGLAMGLISLLTSGCLSSDPPVAHQVNTMQAAGGGAERLSAYVPGKWASAKVRAVVVLHCGQQG